MNGFDIAGKTAAVMIPVKTTKLSLRKEKRSASSASGSARWALYEARYTGEVLTVRDQMPEARMPGSQSCLQSVAPREALSAEIRYVELKSRGGPEPNDIRR